VELLLAHARIDVNLGTVDSDAISPLYAACEEEHVQIIRMLLAHENIDVLHGQSDGRTPLWSACWNGYDDVVEVLLTHKKINVNQINVNKDSGTYGQLVFRIEQIVFDG
jgi:ankyrin repeat protein